MIRNLLGYLNVYRKSPIFIIIIRQQSDLDRPVSTSSDRLFKGLPSRLRPFGIQFNIIFFTLLLFILATRHSEFDLSLLSFWSTDSTFRCLLLNLYIVRYKTSAECNVISHSIINRVLIPAIKRLQSVPNHTHPSSAEFKNEWSCTSTPPVRYHGGDREKLVLFANERNISGVFA